jgi:hypothetical protein
MNNPSKTNHSLKLSLALAAACLCANAFFPGATQAQNLSGSEALYTGNTYSILNQNSTTYVDPTVGGANVGPNACVPTAVAQGLSYLEYYQTSVLGKADPFAVSPNTVTAINSLAAAMSTSQNSTTGNYGTTYPARVTGTTAYLTANPAPSVAVINGQYAPSYSALATIGATSQSPMNAGPVAQFLANGLQNNYGVEFAILWGTLGANNAFTSTGGGHFVTAQSINFNPNTGTGTINFYDPGSASLIQTATLTTTSAGQLYVSYPAPPAPANADQGESSEESLSTSYEDGGAATPGGVIINDLEEAVVPEPATWSLVVGGISAMFAFRKRSRA